MTNEELQRLREQGINSVAEVRALFDEVVQLRELYADRERDLAHEYQRANAAEAAAIAQSEYIQMHGLTEYEQAGLRAEVERLRAALCAVPEWLPKPDAPVHAAAFACVWCGCSALDGHASDCQRQAALGLTP